MANRKKRYEREITLVRDRELLKNRFSKEKKQRKTGLKPVLDFFLQAERKHEFKGHPREAQLVVLFRNVSYLRSTNFANYKVFLELLKHPKTIFSHLHFYEKISIAFKELSSCRRLESWKMPRSKDDKVICKSLFLHLLVPYKIAKCVENAIEDYIFYNYQPDQSFAKIMFHLIQGRGIHQYPSLPIKMNSKMNFLLHQAPAQLDLAQAMWWAKIKSMGASNSIAVQLLDNSYVEIDTAWKDWYGDLIYFLNRFSDIGKSDLRQILNFIIAQKKNGINIRVHNNEELIWVPALFPDFIFKGRTVISVLKFVEKWKTYIQLTKDSGVNGEFPSSTVKPIRIPIGKRIIRIRQIMNLKKLVLEGNKMNHCVATYSGECLSGATSIWSMREISSFGKTKLLLTIEVEEKTKKILQASGNSNRDLKDQEKEWLELWVKKEQLENAIED